MTNPSDFVQIISTCIYAGALGVSLLSVLEVRRNMHVQVEQQLYLDILSFGSRLWNNDIFFKMANESQQVSRYHALVDSPQEYHNITDLLDLFELIFRHHITKVMDKELWPRWESPVKSVMTIPKVKRVWEKTKQFHTPDYVKFIDSM